jgi:hypothetical protein
MRRIQFHIDEELDRAAAEEAARQGISKAELIRSCLAEKVQPQKASDDPWELIIGWLDDDPVEDIDEAIYGP